MERITLEKEVGLGGPAVAPPDGSDAPARGGNHCRATTSWATSGARGAATFGAPNAFCSSLCASAHRSHMSGAERTEGAVGMRSAVTSDRLLDGTPKAILPGVTTNRG